MQVYIVIRDELGAEVTRYEPLGLSFGPGGMIVCAFDVEYPGRYRAEVVAYHEDGTPP